MKKSLLLVLLAMVGLASSSLYAWAYSAITNQLPVKVHVWVGFSKGSGTHFEIAPKSEGRMGADGYITRIDAMRTEGAVNNEVEARWRGPGATHFVITVDRNDKTTVEEVKKLITNPSVRQKVMDKLDEIPDAVKDIDPKKIRIAIETY